MSEVERHVVDSVGQMEPDADGQWVSYKDYCKLEAERGEMQENRDHWRERADYLQSERDMFRKRLVAVEELNICYRLGKQPSPRLLNDLAKSKTQLSKHNENTVESEASDE